jgi:hypothetical protein
MVLDANGWRYLAAAPLGLWRHCAVQLNNKEVMVIGGFITKVANVQTLIYNFDEDKWRKNDAHFITPRQIILVLRRVT